MGIFGLTTYIAEHSSEYLKDHKLRDCSILIDGNAAASIIYSHYTKCIHAFGGDYDKFANCVINFIELLRKCNIYPCFVFDGGYEKRKLKTVIDRIKLNIAICSQFKKKYRESKCFPLLLRDVFKDVLRSVNVPVIQCDYEADQELVVLARILNCPVISNDSDFYISDISYIPFSSLEFKAFKLNKKIKDKFYMRCQIYHVDDLLNKFGGLSDKSLLPLMSCALGNDYIPPQTFKGFLRITHSSKLPTRIEKIVTWLRGVIFAEDAVEQLVSCASLKYRSNLRKIIRQLLEDCNSKSSQLLEHIPESFHINCELSEAMNNLAITDSNDEIDPNVSSPEFEISSIVENDLIGVEDTIYLEDDADVQVIDSYEYEIEEDSYVEVDDSINTSNNLDISLSTSLNETRSKDSLPDWICRKFRLGLISPTVINIHNFKRIFIPSQSEDYYSPPSHMIIVPILEIIIAIVLGKKRATEVKCHARLRSTVAGIYKLNPIFRTDSIEELPSLETVESLDIVARQIMLLKCLNISESVNLKWFPREWKLYVISLIYWLNNCKTMNVNQTYIRSVIICLIYLSVIDKKIGFTRTQAELNRLSNLEKKKKDENTDETNPSEKCNNEDCPKLFDNLVEGQLNDVSQIIDFISKKDCITAANALLHYHQLDNNLIQNRKSFDTKLVHCFAQLQHCIQTVSLLNSVLDFPYPLCMVQDFFCGTFLYNFYNDMCRRKLSDGYITRTLLSKSGGIISLYKYLIKSLTHVVPNIAENGLSNAEKKKKKSKKKNIKNISIPIDEPKAEESDECYVDEENIYSFLPPTDCSC